MSSLFPISSLPVSQPMVHYARNDGTEEDNETGKDKRKEIRQMK
jgi:hypothetical protein